MKHWYLIPLAALLGLAAGTWASRDDMARVKDMRETSADSRKASDTAGFGAFAKMVNIPDVARRPSRANPRRVEGPDAEPEPPKANGAAATNAAKEVASDAPEPSARANISPEDLRARIEEAADLWRTRVEIAKTQWMAKLEISGDEQTAGFETALSKMNDSLYDTMQAMALEIEKSGRVTSELSLRFMGDASTAMAEVYDGVAALIPPEKRGELAEMPVFEFIDPSVAEPLITVQDKLDGNFSRPRRR